MSDPDDRGTNIPLANLRNVVAVDYDPVENFVYWTDVGRHTISRAKPNGDEQEVVAEADSSDGLKLGLKSGLIYWTDTGKNTIERAFFNGSNREVLIADALDEPRAITLDEQTGKMYWTDWGPSVHQIQRADLDGANREVLINETLTNPFGLALDLPGRRMYWAEAWLDNFESADLDGNDRQLLYHEDGINPFSIGLHGNFLYWSDWNKRNIQRIDITTRKNVTEVVLSTGFKMLGLKAFSQDGQRILLVGDYYSIREIDLSVDKDLGRTIPVSLGNPLPLAIDYDPNSGMIYWGDLLTKSIRRMHRDGSAGEHIVTANVSSPVGIAVSWETQQLFWTDNDLKIIQQATLSGRESSVIVDTNLVYPRGIAVDVANRHIYWTDLILGKIERSTFEGENRTIILDGLHGPSALVLDLTRGLMYWGEYVESTMKVATLNGDNPQSVASNVKVFSLTILDNYIYWTDNEKNHTARINRLTGTDASVLLYRDQVMGIRVIHDVESLQPCSSSPCQHGGTCRVLNRRYTCQCQGDWFGNTCQYEPLDIDTVEPLVGPVAGGTNITVSGRNFPSSEALVTIGDVANCTTLTSNSTMIIVTSSPVGNKSGSEEEHAIIVSYPSENLSFSTAYAFKYKANPSVSSVHPLETIKRGGTRLTIEGTNFESVQKPLLKIDNVIQTIETRNNSTSVINETKATYYQPCSGLDALRLVCITPELDVTDTAHFIQDNTPRRRRDTSERKEGSISGSLFPKYLARAQNSAPREHVRRKREARLSQIQNIYIGVILDGVQDFRNLSANDVTKNYGLLIVINPPTFNASDPEKIIKFNPQELLDIKGSGIDKLSLEDYTVRVGQGQCVITETTRNVLYCLPPQRAPPRDKYDPPEGYTIVVSIGQNLKEIVGILSYSFNSTMYIGIGVGSIVILVIIITVMVILIRRNNHKKLKQQSSNDADNAAYNPSAYINLPPVVHDDNWPIRRPVNNNDNNQHRNILRAAALPGGVSSETNAPACQEMADHRRRSPARIQSLYPED